jgi:hypothetical protein
VKESEHDGEDPFQGPAILFGHAVLSGRRRARGYRCNFIF